MLKTIQYNCFKKQALFLFTTFFLIFALSLPVHAGKKFRGRNSSKELKQYYSKNIEGKTIAWVPVALGFPLVDGWTRVMKNEAKANGMKFMLRDPNWNTSVQQQAVSALIASKPDVMVVHNPNVTLLAKQLERAEKAGIYVIQVNMVSRYKTDAYIGVDWFSLGQKIGEDIAKECGKGSGKSGKVAIVQGEYTSSANIEQLHGAMSVLRKSPGIKVVSNQAANWDSTKAHNLTAVTLQQHPDLCATYGFWGIMQLGAAQAVKEAKLSDKVLVYSSGGGSEIICQSIESGLIDKYWNYNAPGQARDIMTTAKTLLQSGVTPGGMKMALYSPLKVLTRENAKNSCWSLASL